MATEWTTTQRVRALMCLPWTVLVERDEEDNSLVARVREVPDAIATGGTERELAKDLWDSLWASLECRVMHDDMVPLPEGQQLPWIGQAPPVPPARDRVIVVKKAGQQLSVCAASY